MRFYKTALEKELLIAKIKKNPSLLNIFRKRKDITEQVNEDIKLRMRGEVEGFVTIFLCGSQGTMKSSSGQEIGINNDETGFNAQKICFTYQEFRDKFEKSKPKEWFILDEQIFLHGTGSGRIIESIQTFIETLRQRQNSMIIISPESKYFPENIFTYTMETIDRSILGRCNHNKELHEIRTCEHRPHKDIKAYVRLAVKKEGTYIGFYITPITWNTPIWQEYSKRKTKFLQRVLTEDFQKVDYEKIAKKILEKPESEHYKTSKQLMLLLEKTHPNLAVGEKQLIVEEIKIKRKEQQGE